MICKGTNISIAEGIIRMGGDDRRSPIFEGEIPIPEGVSYNSYVILDEKTVLLDTCDESVSHGYMSSLEDALSGRDLDYFVISHMEPDHGAAIGDVIRNYPEATVVASGLAFEMLANFLGINPEKRLVVEDGTVLELGKRSLTFISASMVHWPEVMMSYESKDGILFSADAFGTFGALDGAVFADQLDFDGKYMDEARRYYTNIVGKYGAQVRKVLDKSGSVEIKMICPLHGPIWRGGFGEFVGKYVKWSGYEPEEDGVVIGYASMYGNTADAADTLATMLRSKGVKVVVHDLSRRHSSYLVSDAFRFSNIVLAAPTYNNGLHPAMSAAIENMESMTIRARKYSIIGNGSWAPRSHEFMCKRMEALKDMTMIGEPVVFKSSLKDEDREKLARLADEIAASIGN